MTHRAYNQGVPPDAKALFKPVSEAQWAHRAESIITNAAIVGSFVMVTTESHGTYFIDQDGGRVLLPIE